jgi:hypothetical protein
MKIARICGWYVVMLYVISTAVIYFICFVISPFACVDTWLLFWDSSVVLHVISATYTGRLLVLLVELDAVSTHLYLPDTCVVILISMVYRLKIP